MKLVLKVPADMAAAEQRQVVQPASALNFVGLAGAAADESVKLTLKVPSAGDIQTPAAPGGPLPSSMTAVEIDDMRQQILAGKKVDPARLREALAALRAGRFSFSAAVTSKKAEKEHGVDLTALPDIV